MAKRSKKTKVVIPNAPDLNIDPYQIADLQQLDALRVKLSKRANQRMRRLESTQSQFGTESYADYGAAEIAKFYLEKTGRSNRFTEQAGAGRFRTASGILSSTSLRNEIKELQRFLAAPTSTVAGQKKIEQLRVEAFKTGNWKGGMAITFGGSKQFYQFLNSKVYKNLRDVAGFTSEQIIEVYEQARQQNVTVSKSGRRRHQSHEETMRAFRQAWEQYQAGQQASFKDLQQSMGLTELI